MATATRPLRPPVKTWFDDGMESRPRFLPRLTYRFRVLGMGLASLPVMVVLHDLQAGWPAWAWTAFACFLWPHLAYWTAIRSADGYGAETRNFMVDSALAGSLVPMMHFNLLPSAVLLTVVSADKVNSGIPGLWRRALPGMLLALLASGFLHGWALALPSSTLVIAACLPLMAIHTLAVSANIYRLMRRVNLQNRQLEELTRRDELTGLDSRGHWRAQAAERIERLRHHPDAATLLLLDIDHFKSINDRYGHAAGDDVLRALAGLLRDCLPPSQVSGRLGGDEFAVLLPMNARDAGRAAERLRQAARALELPGHPGLRFSLSIGLAAPAPGTDLRAWLEAADQALYRAKDAGRDRTATAMPAMD